MRSDDGASQEPKKKKKREQRRIRRNTYLVGLAVLGGGGQVDDNVPVSSVELEDLVDGGWLRGHGQGMKKRGQREAKQKLRSDSPFSLGKRRGQQFKVEKQMAYNGRKRGNGFPGRLIVVQGPESGNLSAATKEFGHHENQPSSSVPSRERLTCL